MTITAATPSALADLIGVSVTGPAVRVDQARIDAFAEITEDRQWIHIDAQRAAAGPFGTTIAHGYLTLSLLPRLTEGLIDVGAVGLVMNYGLDRVRFLRPVPSGASVRARLTLESVEETSRGWRATFGVVVETVEDGAAVLAAAMIALFVPTADGEAAP